jgi:hypothetical protein
LASNKYQLSIVNYQLSTVMADGFLESHYAEYEKRKAEWLKRKKHSIHPIKNTENGRKTPTDPS